MTENNVRDARAFPNEFVRAGNTSETRREYERRKKRARSAVGASDALKMEAL